MVCATATPNRNGPAKVAAAASSRQPRALMAREAITVETMLAPSWKPFTKSCSAATASSTRRSVIAISWGGNWPDCSGRAATLL